MKGVKTFTPFKIALGDVDGQSEFRRNEFSPSSSMLPMASLHKRSFPITEQEIVEPVAIRRLDNIVRDLVLPDDILVKMDVQGYEDKVISGGQSLFSRAKVAIVETSFFVLYDGQPLFDEIYALFRAMGFRYMGNFDQLKSPLDGTILQADAIFMKEDVTRMLASDCEPETDLKQRT